MGRAAAGKTQDVRPPRQYQEIRLGEKSLREPGHAFESAAEVYPFRFSQQVLKGPYDLHDSTTYIQPTASVPTGNDW